MSTLWRRKIASLFIVLLLVLSGCSSHDSVPAATTPTNVEQSNQAKNPEQQNPTDKTDTGSAPNTLNDPSEKVSDPIVDPPKSTPASEPSTPPVVDPAPVAQPAQEPVVTSAPSTPPVVTPAPAPAQTPQDVTVYITKTGKKYHSDGCRYLSKSKIPISLSNAKMGYEPCSVCNPPQ